MFLELNNGMPSGGAAWYDDRLPSITTLFSALFDFTSVGEFDAFFRTVKSNFAYIIGIADAGGARRYEWPTYGVTDEPKSDGLIVATNHFTDSSWKLTPPDDAANWRTLTRYDNLRALAEGRKGVIDPLEMMAMLDTPLESGGALSDMTVYQLVVAPERFALWIKIPNVQEWTPIDMRPLLKVR